MKKRRAGAAFKSDSIHKIVLPFSVLYFIIYMQTAVFAGRQNLLFLGVRGDKKYLFNPLLGLEGGEYTE